MHGGLDSVRGPPLGRAQRGVGRSVVLMRSSPVRRSLVPPDEGRTPMGINLGVGALAVVVVAMLAAALPPADLWARLGVMALLVAGFAAITGDEVALGGVVLMVWLVSNGFF